MKRLGQQSWLIWGFLVVVLGLTIGITDDEAYYWVLGQKPALGYAFHPPAIGWSVWLSDRIFGPILRFAFGDSAWTRLCVTRLPALILMTLSLRLVLKFLRSVLPAHPYRFAALLAFPGVFATCWMMVPDLPLILGWSLLFYGTYFSRFWLMLLGAAVAVWGKFSGVLAIASAAFWLIRSASLARPERRRGFLALGLGLGLGVAPILIWNAQHDWMSLRFQFLERHQGGQVSWLRWARFILIQFAAAGPLLFCFPAWIGKISAPLRNYFLTWFAPAAAVFFVQPLFSDFKPHWALIAWWPMAIAMAVLVETRAQEYRRVLRIQVGWAIALTLAVWSSLWIPWVSRLGIAMNGREFNPTLDIGNDLRAWNTLGDRLRADLSESDRQLPLIGSRYQTASQAALALDGLVFPRGNVTHFPKDLKAKDEWPDLPAAAVSDVASGTWGSWGKLRSPLLFVADNRYSAPPEFRQARCQIILTHAFAVDDVPTKTIQLYRCVPIP